MKLEEVEKIINATKDFCYSIIFKDDYAYYPTEILIKNDINIKDISCIMHINNTIIFNNNYIENVLYRKIKKLYKNDIEEKSFYKQIILERTILHILELNILKKNNYTDKMIMYITLPKIYINFMNEIVRFLNEVPFIIRDQHAIKFIDETIFDKIIITDTKYKKISKYRAIYNTLYLPKITKENKKEIKEKLYKLLRNNNDIEIIIQLI